MKTKQEKNDYQRDWRKKNKDKKRQHEKNYYEKVKNKPEYILKRRKLEKTHYEANKEKVRNYQNEYHKKLQADPSVKGKLWSYEEDLLLFSELSDKELVQTLGRSVLSIQQRRFRLRNGMKIKASERLGDIITPSNYRKEIYSSEG